MIAIILVIALVASNAAWWLYVRKLNGVVSDLKDIGSDLKAAQAKATIVVDQVKSVGK